MGVVCGKKSIIKKNENKDKQNKSADEPTLKKEKTNNSFENKSTTDKKEEITEDKNKKKKDPKMLVALDPNIFVTKGITNPREIYLREKALGQGSFGTVYLVKHLQLQRYFAMKVIKKKTKSPTEEGRTGNRSVACRQ